LRGSHDKLTGVRVERRAFVFESRPIRVYLFGYVAEVIVQLGIASGTSATAAPPAATERLEFVCGRNALSYEVSFCVGNVRPLLKTDLHLEFFAEVFKLSPLRIKPSLMEGFISRKLSPVLYVVALLLQARGKHCSTFRQFVLVRSCADLLGALPQPGQRPEQTCLR
jgi:hypothetical protein